MIGASDAMALTGVLDNATMIVDTDITATIGVSAQVGRHVACFV